MRKLSAEPTPDPESEADAKLRAALLAGKKISEASAIAGVSIATGYRFWRLHGAELARSIYGEAVKTHPALRLLRLMPMVGRPFAIF
jgi:hypothetical protein